MRAGAAGLILVMGIGCRAHWDGGIYNHGDGVTTRTVYISNLSVGLK